MFEIGRPDLDWMQLAKGMGVPCTRVNSLEAFGKALRAGLEGEGSTLIEVCRYERLNARDCCCWSWWVRIEKRP